jgi:hypothetical protein
MAHFAKLDENNVVIDVNVVNNSDLDSSNEEVSGVVFLTEWSGGHSNWKQTSYNKSFRKNYAGIGYTYNPVLDAFIPPKPASSWVLDEDKCIWIAPIPYPGKLEDQKYKWDEASLSWIEVAP